MTLEDSCSRIFHVPIKFIELKEQSEVSVTSTMSENANTQPISDGVERNTVSTEGSTVCSYASPGKTKLLWNGVQEFSVGQVYLDNLVEIPTKDEMTTLKSTIKRVVFPRMKFIPNWDDCLVLSHDKEKDIEEKSAGWAYNIFKRMNWESDTLFQPWMQAIKWNTYKYSFKQNFNSVRASIIAALKKHLISGKACRIYFFTSMTTCIANIIVSFLEQVQKTKGIVRLHDVCFLILV